MAVEPKATLDQLLKHLGFESTIDETPTDEGVMLNINSEDAGRLIGRQGQTLADLQYITNRLLHKQDQNAPRVSIDVGGYRSQAKDAVVKKAMEAADKVRRWGDVVELEPMNGFDRYIVHNALKDDPDIVTQSVEVEGTNKKAMLLRPKH